MMNSKYFGVLCLAVGMVAVSTGCTKSVKGTYACSGGIFLKGLQLDSKDQAIVTGDVFGQIQKKQATYQVDGDKVNINMGGQVVPFTIKGNNLDGGEIGGTCVPQ